MIKSGEPERTVSIELTPIVDMVFLLLIFFLVATTFHQTEREMQIALPASISADQCGTTRYAGDDSLSLGGWTPQRGACSPRGAIYGAVSESHVLMKSLLTVHQVAELLGVRYRSVLDLIHLGQLRAFKIGRNYRIAEEDLRRYLGSVRLHLDWKH